MNVPKPLPQRQRPIARDLRSVKYGADTTTEGMYIRPKPRPVRTLKHHSRRLSEGAKLAVRRPRLASSAPAMQTGRQLNRETSLSG